MLLVYSSDTPLYHYPFATVGAMVLCVVFSLGAITTGSTDYILVWGDGYHPTQWVTSNFAHVGIAHLVINLMFLFCFGLVVEGKIG